MKHTQRKLHPALNNKPCLITINHVLIKHLDLHVRDEPLQQHEEILASNRDIWRKKKQGVDCSQAFTTVINDREGASLDRFTIEGSLNNFDWVKTLPPGYKTCLTKWMTPFVAMISDSGTWTEFTCIVLFAWRRQLKQLQTRKNTKWRAWTNLCLKHEDDVISLLRWLSLANWWF